MRRLGFYMTLTADGMYADRGGGLGWYDPADDEHIYANGLMRDAGAVVIGRVMYEVFEHWDTVDLDDPAVPAVERDFATFWRQTPKHVVSRGRPPLRPNATLWTAMWSMPCADSRTSPGPTSFSAAEPSCWPPSRVRISSTTIGSW